MTLSASNSQFCTLFIILIVVVNVSLIVKHVRRGGFYDKCKVMILLSMATGNIVLALFPLVVLARFYYEKNYEPPYGLNVVTSSYVSHLLHFAHVIFLILLGAEPDILARKSLPASLSRLATALLMSCLPWVISIILVMPLFMVGFKRQHFAPPITLLSMFCFLTLTSIISVIIFIRLKQTIFAQVELRHQQRGFNLNTDQEGAPAYFNQQVSVVTPDQQNHCRDSYQQELIMNPSQSTASGTVSKEYVEFQDLVDSGVYQNNYFERNLMQQSHDYVNITNPYDEILSQPLPQSQIGALTDYQSPFPFMHQPLYRPQIHLPGIPLTPSAPYESIREGAQQVATRSRQPSSSNHNDNVARGDTFERPQTPEVMENFRLNSKKENAVLLTLCILNGCMIIPNMVYSAPHHNLFTPLSNESQGLFWLLISKSLLMPILLFVYSHK
ncbi:POU domain class 6 transcription factor 2 [Biomphalaria pfeifferi]|uniref:POU domain class 6 transcription factor 2 n=1 Tax=Biomphalaria pfeifferi TaxID=112525 RepID=A0AAD8BJT3_BIOPF|nr:POU domain class 6 transcription factor 2 [Biomphalaria pfeifferi]